MMHEQGDFLAFSLQSYDESRTYVFELGKGAAYVQHGREFDHDVWRYAEQVILQGYGIRLAVTDGYEFATGITSAGGIQIDEVKGIRLQM